MGPIRGRSVAGLAAGALALLAFASPASATPSTYTVSSFSDGAGSCSGTVCTTLRAATQAAVNNPGSTIQLGAGTYDLSSGQIQMGVSSSDGDALTIEGAGAGQTIIRQTDGVDRVLAFAGGPFLLEDVEITGGTYVGASGGYEGFGGGIYANAALSLDHVAIIGNSVVAGSGTAGSSPANGGSAYGGGLSEITTSTVTFSDSTIADNTVVGGAGGSSLAYAGTAGGFAYGGGVSINGPAEIVGTTISGNTVTGGAGGGSIELSAGNGGSAYGGGLEEVGSLTLVNSTLAGNTAAGGAAASGELDAETSDPGGSEGGGLSGVVGNDIFVLASDTLDANTAGVGGDFASGGLMEAISLNNTVFADGVATGDVTDQSGNCSIAPASGLVVYDHGYNLETDSAPSSGTSACALSTANHDLFAGSAKLGALADNGGPTETMLPQSGSPVLRAGGACLDPTVTPAVPLTTDQRDEPRGSTCDIGAVQVQAAAASGEPQLTGTPAVGQTLSCSAAGIFSGDGLSVGYAWLRDGTAIDGQTGTSYQLTTADAGTTVSCATTATAITGPPVTASASVTVPAAPTGPPAKPASTSTPGTAKLLTKVLTANGGRVKPRLGCVGGTSGCSGKLRITIVVKHRTVQLAAGPYRINSAGAETLALRLSARARKLLASHAKGLRATLTLTPTGHRAHSSRVTIKPKPAKHKKKR